MPGVRIFLPAALLAILLSIGCNKSGPAGGATSGSKSAGLAVNKQAVHDASTLLANIKAANTQAKRTQAIQHAIELDEQGEDVVPTLLEALKDRTASPLGNTYDERPESSRETAVQALLGLKKKGKQALLESGLKTLEGGLKDKEPNVREHTVNAIGMIGSDASSSSDLVCKLCADREKEVRGAAYRTLQKFKKFNPAPILRLLKHSNLEVAGEAAAALTWIKPTGAESVQPLLEAVKREPRAKEEPSDVRFIQNAAAEALANVGKGAETAVPALVELMVKSKMEDVEAMFRPSKTGDSLTVTGPVRALRRIGKPAVPAVVPYLKHADPLVRYQAAAVLSGMKVSDAAEALPQIQEALEAERGLPSGQMYVFGELANATINLGGAVDKVLKIIIELLGDDNENARFRACKMLARVGPKAAPATPRLMELLNDKFVQVQLAAIDALGAIGPAAKEAVIELGKKVPGENVEVGREAAQALRQFGPAAAPATADLAKALDSNDQNMCVDASLTIAAIGPDAVAAVPAIVKHLGEENSRREERIAMLQATGAIGPPAKDALPNVTKLIADKDPPVRAAAIETLGKIAPGNPEAIKTLAGLLKDMRNIHPTVHIAVVKTLGRMGVAGNVAAGDIKTFVETTKDAQSKVWAAAALVALGTDTDANTKLVVAAIKDVTPTGKSSRVAGIDAAELLGAKGKPAVPALLDALKDKSTVSRGDKAQVREHAAHTLGALGAIAKEAVKPLIDLLRDSDRNMRRAAVEALGLFGPEAVSAAPKLREVSRTDSELASEIQAALNRIEPMKKME